MNNNNKPADSVRVDIHDWNGNLMDRMKARSTEKSKGALIVDRLTAIFDVSEEDIKEAKALEDAKREEKNKNIPEWKRPIIWKRDSRGNII